MANKPLTWSFHMIDKRTGEVTDLPEGKVPEEVKAKWAERLSQTMSDYYTQHMDEYIKLPSGG